MIEKTIKIGIYEHYSTKQRTGTAHKQNCMDISTYFGKTIGFVRFS